MTRRPTTSIVASPVLIGTVTVLVTIVAVFLAYNANQGLPFVPSLDVRIHAENAAGIGRGAEVREGGLRLGSVREVEPVTLPDGRAGAEFEVQLDAGEGEIPADTTFTIRPRSPLGLKYLEMVRGSAPGGVRQGHRFRADAVHLPVELDRVTGVYDGRTRRAVADNLNGYGNAFAGRGASLNRALGDLPRFLRHAAPVARNLADPDTDIGRFLREAGDAARVVAPVADLQAELFSRAADTFEAISRDTQALRETIRRTHPALQAGIESFPVQRPFLTESAALARELRPVARELGPALPRLNRALGRGIPVVRASTAYYGRLERPLVSLRELARDPATGIALRALTATSTALKPQLRYLGPYQTVCNSWNYFWTYLGEHVGQSGPYGFSQRTSIKSAGQQTSSPSSMGAAEPANGAGYVEASRVRGDPAHLHGTAYNAAIDDEGNADCENGQRGYVRRLSRFGAARFNINTDFHFPGNQGPTYTGRPRVPAGQTFTREPETGEVHP